jgi:hypothetical protein
MLILLVPCEYACVAHRRVDEGEEPRIIIDGVWLRVGNLANDLVVKPGRRAQT